MASLAADVGAGVGAQVANSFLEKIKKHIDYLIKYKENLENLEKELGQLDAKRGDVSRFLNETKNQFKDVGRTTDHWITTADVLYKGAGKISSGNNVSCLNLCSRYSLSKNAWEYTQKIKDKVNETQANDFYQTYKRQARGHAFNIEDFMEFESRQRVLDYVLEALKDDKVTMCSMCGMGGMGKTMLAKKLVKRVEEDHLFDKVAFVTVSQNPKLEAIQKKILQELGLEGTAKNTELFAWLSGNNTLLILDDVWSALSNEDFEKVGVPLMNKSCKIVLTSRNESVCTQMGSKKNFIVGVLEQEDAWSLFTQIAGNSIENSGLEGTARMIAKECDGLPLAIVTIAMALKGNRIGVWRHSLQQLQSSNPSDEMDKVYSRIRLSYDLLDDKEAQKCFLLCCLFPEDSDISAGLLVFIAKGLDLFDNVRTISEAKDKAEKSISKLKKSFLLLDGELDGCVKMHDIMRRFAISISSSSYLVRHGKETTKWPEAHEYETCRGISLIFEEIKEHPVHLRCPELEQLILCFGDGSTELPFDFFEGMTKLKVLLLVVPLISLPLSKLKELRTLIIGETSNHGDERAPPKIGDLLGHGDLQKLEIFVIYSLLRPWNDFPVEIGLLCNLRLLSVSDVPFEYMPPDVLSKLVNLEELLLSFEFSSWGCKEQDGERVNASLDEIESLPLTRLDVSIKEGTSFGEKLVKKLERFKIMIGSCAHVDEFNDLELNAALGVSDVDASIVTMYRVIPLLEKSEFLGLDNVRKLKNIMFLPRFIQLKKIEIQHCEDMDCLITTTMQAHGFTNLTHIVIFNCNKLKYVFPLSMARELRQLQSIDIGWCDDLKEIFFKVDDDDGNQIVRENIPTDEVAMGSEVMFPQLKKLELANNPKLRVFYGGHEPMELPSVEKIEIWNCDTTAISYGSFRAPKLKQVLLDRTNYYKDGVEDLNAVFKQWKLARELREDGVEDG